MVSENYSTKWRTHTRKRILERDGYICGWCSCDLKTLGASATVDHIVSIKNAREQGWTEAEINDDSNLVAACKPCNSSRAHRAGPPKRTRSRSSDATDPGRSSQSPVPWLDGLLNSPRGSAGSGQPGDGPSRWTMTPTKGLI